MIIKTREFKKALTMLKKYNTDKERYFWVNSVGNISTVIIDKENGYLGNVKYITKDIHQAALGKNLYSIDFVSKALSVIKTDTIELTDNSIITGSKIIKLSTNIKPSKFYDTFDLQMLDKFDYTVDLKELEVKNLLSTVCTNKGSRFEKVLNFNKANNLDIASTDGRQLTRVIKQAYNSDIDELQVNLPTFIFYPLGNCQVKISNLQAMIKTGDLVIHCKTLSINFPDISKIMPDDLPEDYIKLDYSNLSETLNIIDKLSKEDYCITLYNNKLVHNIIESEAIKTGSLLTPARCNYKNLLNYININKQDITVYKLNGMVFINHDNIDYISVVMDDEKDNN